MARNFRFYEKKRGNRRTGSNKLGSAGEALFFAVFFLLGCGGLVAMFATLVVPEWRTNHEFIKDTCTVRETRIGQKRGEDGTLYRPEVQIEYRIDGETYRIWTYDIHTIRGGGYSTDQDDTREILDRFQVDQQYLCYYDPSDPNVAVLVWGSSWWVWLSLIVPVSFVLIGGGGLVYAIFTLGKSAERRAAIAKRAAHLDPFGNNGRSKPDFPHVPVAASITDSPGTKLAFRLPIAGSAVWALFAWLAACVLWNGIVSVFVMVAFSGYVRGQPDWFLTAFIIPFVLIGIGLIVFFLRQLVIATGIGPTLLEISDQPLYPGQRYRLFFWQTGRLKMNSLELLLVCEEETTYRHGTDTRTETRRVYQRPLFYHEGFKIEGGLPFEADCEIEVPPTAMHSFRSGHNEVNWKVLVKGDVAGWPNFQRSFPVIVYPPLSRRKGRNGNAKA